MKLEGENSLIIFCAEDYLGTMSDIAYWKFLKDIDYDIDFNSVKDHVYDEVYSIQYLTQILYN